MIYTHTNYFSYIARIAIFAMWCTYAAAQQSPSPLPMPMPPPQLPTIPPSSIPVMGLSLTQDAGSGAKDPTSLCKRVMKSYVPAIRMLVATLKPDEIKRIKNDGYRGLLSWTEKSCTLKADRGRVLSQVAKALTSHDYRVGVIQRSGFGTSPLTSEILTGFNSATNGLGMRADQIAITSPGTNLDITRAVAELLLLHNVTVLVGGYERIDADQLARWAHVLRIPTLILNHNINLLQRSPFAFSVFPNPLNLSDNLTGLAVSGAVKRVAILRPNTNGAATSAATFRAKLEAAGIFVEPDVTFSNDDFPSLEAAAQKLLQVGPTDRKSEMNKLMYEARMKARKEGVGFNPKMIVLPPRIEFDAVFIPANFKTVRYIARMFKFLGAPSVRMLGTFEWRSRAIIEPWDPYLENAVFADFFGDYIQLPPALQPTTRSTYFMNAEDSRKLDFRAIGYYAGNIAARAVGSTNTLTKRNVIHKTIENMTHPVNDPFFPDGKAFDGLHASQWRTKLLRIFDKSIMEISPADGMLFMMPSPSPTPLPTP